MAGESCKCCPPRWLKFLVGLHRRRQRPADAGPSAEHSRGVLDWRRSFPDTVLLRLVLLPVAGRAAAKGTDVYFFLAGMMLLSELAREHGVFDWLSSLALHSAKGSYRRLFLLVYAVGTVVTIFMSNDATAKR